jgi:AraC family transcriptional regulator
MSLYLLASEISKAFDYIENNLTNKIALEDIAAVSGLSKYHLHRILSAIANRPLMEYVRARKLSESLGKLADRRVRIIDIALEYSFDYEQSYIRAFRKEFGLSPGVFRTQSASVKATEKICRKFYIDRERNRWDSAEDFIGSAFLSTLRHGGQRHLDPDVYIGLTYKQGLDAERVYYLSSQEVPSLEGVPEGFSIGVLPSSRYAVFKYIGLFSIECLKQSHLEELWEYIDHAWLPRSTFSTAGEYHFESIYTRLIKENYCEIDLYVPVDE